MGPSNNVGMWALYPEDRTLKNGQNLNSLLTQPAIDGYLQHEKEKVRRTILKHESIFRQQIKELHRLYRRQRELMNENRQTELHEHLMPVEALPRVFGPNFSSSEEKMTGHVLLDLTLKPSALEIGINHSPLSSVKGKSMLSFFPSQDQTSSNDLESVKPKVSQSKMFDLEPPADARNNYGSEEQEGKVCPESGGGSCFLNGNKVPCDGNANGFPGVFNFGHHGHTLGSNLYPKRTHDLTYLKVPIRAEQMCIAASTKNLDSSPRIKEEILKCDVSSNTNARLHLLCRDFTQSPLAGRDGGMYLHNAPSESGRVGKEQLKYNFRAEETRCNDHSSNGVAPFPDDLPRMFKSSQFDHGKADEHQPKKAIFGVEISEDHVQCSIAANAPPVCHQNDQFGVNHSKTSFVLPWRIMSCASDHNMKLVQQNHSNATSNSSKRVFNLLAQCAEYVGDKTQPNSHMIASSSCQGGHFLGSTSDAKPLQSFCSATPYNLSFGTNTNSASKQSVHQQEIVSINGPRKHEIVNGSLPWLTAKPCVSSEQDRGRKTFYEDNLNSLQNCSHQLSEDLDQISVKDPTSLVRALDNEAIKIAEVDCLSTRKILGFPISDAPQVSRCLTSVDSSTEECLVPDVKLQGYRKYLTGDAEYGNQPEMEDLVADKGVNNYIIDLNSSLNEDEVPPVKIATNEIDLEVSAVLETETDVTPEAETPQTKCEMASKLSQVESKEAYEELVRVAADAIISISSSKTPYTCIIDATQPSEASSIDCLRWFVEVVVSSKGENESKLKEFPMTVDGASNEELIPNNMDYLEYMTLKLKDTMEEEYLCEMHISEDQKYKEISTDTLPKRPRKGQGRRGRQRKDFQRDILPGLVSLSRHEVTEDLQTIEDLFRASGCTWQSSLSQRNTAKNGRRKRWLASSLAAVEVCSPPAQKAILREVGPEEISLTGWGKRTRRLPRQRYLNANHALASYC